MSLNRVAVNQKTKVFYRGNQLSGITINGEQYGPKEMLKVLKRYEELLRRGDFKGVRGLEQERGLPKTLLNTVISGLILENGTGLAERLIKEFSDRGYCPGWRERFKSI